MLCLKEAVVVEGRYDKIALENQVDTEIFTTDGFGIFNDEEKMSLLRRVAEKRGLIVLTDADGAGLMIRNRLRGCIGERFLKHAYIPAVPGKERRKTAPSREGTLGVEGMSPAVLEEALRRAGADMTAAREKRLTKADLYFMGLSGARDAAGRRARLLSLLDLPKNLSANAMLDALNSLYTPQEVSAAVMALQEQRGEVAHEDHPQGV